MSQHTNLEGMDPEVFAHIMGVLEAEQPGIYKTVSDIQDYLMYGLYPVYTEDLGECRWWNNTRDFVKVGDRYIGFINATATATDDSRPLDLGCEFDNESVKFATRIEETVVVVRYVV